MANLYHLLPSRRLLAHLRRYPRPFLQRVRRLRYHTRTNGWTGWKSRKSAWITDTGVQCELCVLSRLYGYLRSHSSSARRMRGANVNVRRTRLPHLPHLLPSHQHHLLHDFLLPRLRLWLLGRCILEPGPCVRKSYQHNGSQESWETRRCKFHLPTYTHTHRAQCCRLTTASSLGRWRLHIRHVHGRLVDLLRYHARVFGLPVQYPGGRFVAYH